MRGIPVKNKNQWQLDDNFIEKKLAESFGYENEQLVQELDHFKEQISTEYLSGRSRAPEGEFQRILNRLDQGNNTVKGHKGIRLKKVAKFVVATAVMGTMVLGSGMWVGARRIKEYQIRERSDLENVVVFGNDSDNVIISEDDESAIEKAYAQIEKELGIEVLELSYLPEDILFDRLIIKKRKGLIIFSNESKKVFFYQGLNDNTSSFSFSSNIEKCKQVYNIYLNKKIEIYKEELENGSIDFSAQIVEGNKYYLLHGVIDIEEFDQIVCGIKLYRD